MNPQLQSDFLELAASGLSVEQLHVSLCARLSAVAHEDYGRNDRVAAFFGVHPQTITRWNTAGRKQGPLAEPLAHSVRRIAQAIYEAHRAPNAGGQAAEPGVAPRKVADRILDEFDARLVRAAMERTHGNKRAAARVLGAHRNWVLSVAKVNLANYERASA